MIEKRNYTTSTYRDQTDYLISEMESNCKNLEDELTNLRLISQREISDCNNNINQVRDALLRALGIMDKLNIISDTHRRLIDKQEKRWKITTIIFSIFAAIDIVAIAVLFIHLIN